MAAGRAATLTQRLLAFGRRQALDAKLLVLGDLIGGMAGLIERTVGPGITVDVQMKNGSWPVTSVRLKRKQIQLVRIH
jgi:hypothetical protein